MFYALLLQEVNIVTLLGNKETARIVIISLIVK